MAKQSTGIQHTDFTTKWGLVTVDNADGTLNREYVITAAEADAVAQGNNVLPPGCTQAEWESGLVTVNTRPCHVGQAVRNPDGTMIVNYGVAKVGKRVDVSLMKLEATEWEKIGDTVMIDAAVADTVDVPFKAVR